MGYTRSIPLEKWQTTRRDAVETLATAHAQIGEVDGRGQPLRIGAVVNDEQTWTVGQKVKVPWGVDEVDATVVEVWGDPPVHVRVQLHLNGDEPEPIILLSPTVLTAA